MSRDTEKTTVTRSKSCEKDFMLASTERKPDACKADRCLGETSHILQKRFKQLKCKEDLADYAAKRLASSKLFTVLILSVDSPDRLISPDTVLTKAALALESVCKRENGFWGLEDAFVLAAFFDNMEARRLVDYVKKIQQAIASKTPGTVSAGIAEFPVLSYKRFEIIECAKKALVHAGFFGHNSFAVFDAVTLNISGDELYQKNDIKGAIEEYKKGLKLDPENTNLLNSLGVCYGMQGKLDLALLCFEKAIQKDPEELMAVYNAGYVYMLKKDYKTALGFFARADAIEPDVFEVIFQSGRVHLEMGEADTARRLLEKAKAINPESKAIHRFLGDAYVATEQFDKAEVHYKTALKYYPEDADVLSALGFLYETQKRNADIALIFCKKACEINPAKGIFHYRLGRLLFNRNIPNEALEAFKLAEAHGYPAGSYIKELQKVISANEGLHMARS